MEFSPDCAAMVQSPFHQYWDIPDGTECHRKAYASTSIGGATGERCPGRENGGRRKVVGSLGAVRGHSERLSEGVRAPGAVMGRWGTLVRGRLCGGVGLTQRVQDGYGVTGSCPWGLGISRGDTWWLVGCLGGHGELVCGGIQQAWRAPRGRGACDRLFTLVVRSGPWVLDLGVLWNDHQALSKSWSGTEPSSGSKEMGGHETSQRGNFEMIWGDIGLLLGCLTE